MILVDGKEWRPISFVDQLVTAIQHDLKDTTRRIVGGAPHGCDGHAWIYEKMFAAIEYEPDRIARFKCPYGKLGGFLWVRESFCAFKIRGWSAIPSKIDEADFVSFRDGSRQWKDGRDSEVPAAQLENAHWRPPMHLPFWAYRIGLEVVSIGIERVQQISEAEAVAEGFHCRQIPGYEHLSGVPAREDFITKWDQINGKRKDKKTGHPYSWEGNPFVWVVKFKRLKEENGQA